MAGGGGGGGGGEGGTDETKGGRKERGETKLRGEEAYLSVCPVGEIKRETLRRFICSCLGVVDGCSEGVEGENFLIRSKSMLGQYYIRPM